MRAPNSRRSLLNAPSSSFVLVSSSIVLSIFLIAPIPVSTRSVARASDDGIPETIAGLIMQTYDLEDSGIDVDASEPGKNEDEPEDHSSARHRISRRNIGASSIADEQSLSSKIDDIKDPKETSDASIASFGRPKGVEIAKEEQEGIRRFDAVIASDDNLGKASSVSEEKSQHSHDPMSEIGKTVTKGIIVRDDPIDAGIVKETYLSHGIVETSKLNQHRKRSLGDDESSGTGPESSKENPAIDDSVSSSGSAKLISSPGDARVETAVDSIETPQVPVLIPVGSSPAKPLHKQSKNVEAPSSELIVSEPLENVDESPAIEEASSEAEIQKGKSEIDPRVRKIPELNQPNEKSIGEVNDNEKSEIVVPEKKTIIINPDGLGDAEQLKEVLVQNSRKSLPIADETKENDDEDEPVESEIEAKKIKEEKLKPLKNKDSEDFDVSSLMNIVKTNVSLEGLKLLALSLQKDIKDSAYMERLINEGTQVLPGIPTFDEAQLLGALHAISVRKEDHDAEYSYLPKLDTGALSDNQLTIIRCAEALVVREQRQTFTENMFECIRGLSMLNCMRIFVWPIIADNIPEAFSQNLPTLPIEVNVMDWLPGNREKPRLCSPASSDQPKLVTPELVVSSILKDALNANPSTGDIATTFIDPYNETLSKLLTPGQLEILKMAEKFLPESARQEYSNRMYSCVRRFEYFSCIKYFAWPMVKQHFDDLPEFPNYQSWYPSVTLYPGYPILPFPNSEGIGELPEVVEADATRTRSPRPEAVIVHILENTLRQSQNLPISYHYQGRHPEASLAPLTAEQMSIFFMAQQFIPASMRAEYMSKTMKCIRDYDYLTCTKYATWPTVRQWAPTLPSFPDFSSWFPTFAVPEIPDFSQYIPDFSSYFPGFPGIPGFPTTTTTTTTPAPATTTTPKPQPQPIPDKPPPEAASNSAIIVSNATSTRLKEQQSPEPENPIESRIIQILSNIRWTVLARNTKPAVPLIDGNSDVLYSLTYNQMQILGLATSVVPHQIRGDMDARFVGCLQGGTDFMSCTRKVIWPTLQLYVRDLPLFPDEEMEKTKEALPKSPQAVYIGNIVRQPGVYQPIVGSLGPVGFAPLRNVDPEIEGRSPSSSEITAESDELPIPMAPIQREAQISENIPEGQENQESIENQSFAEQKIFAKSSDSSAPVISITDTSFTPIFHDNPETVLLKILTVIQSSSKIADPTTGIFATAADMNYLREYLNEDELRVILASERLLPDGMRVIFVERISECVESSNFLDCSRNIVWPTLSRVYPALPSFPNFNIDDTSDDSSTGSLKGSKKSSGIAKSGGAAAAISETDVKTGQHGDAVVTITDTRFVPLFSQHPEAVILGILKNVQSSSPNLLIQQIPKVATRSSEFTTSFTDQQGNIITVSENLLPESIREVFTKRMTECVKENSFLACTRDIAWPTIAQFFPRLPNFPNIGALPEIAIEEPQRPTLLPPQLEAGVGPGLPTKTPIATEEPSLAVPTPNLLPVSSEDLETKVESMLRQISSSSSYPQAKTSFLNTMYPLPPTFYNERQTNIIRIAENLLPNDMKPVLVGSMVQCSRQNDFTLCLFNVAWPMLRQYLPNIPEFPDLSNFGSYFPQVPQEIPQIPQFPDYQGQLPQLPNYPGFGLPGQGYGYPFRPAQDKIDRPIASYINERGSLVNDAGHQSGEQSGAAYVQGIHGITPSVGTIQPSVDRVASSLGSLVSGSRIGSIDLLIDPALGTSTKRRERRSLAAEPIESHQDIVNDTNDSLRLNVTESEFLQLLINVTKLEELPDRGPEVYLVDKLDPTTKQGLTADQYAILKIVEDISRRSTRAGTMSKVFQCITSLSFIRCMGIFVWPMITQNVPSLLGLPTLGSLNPFGRSSTSNDSFADIFGMTREQFESELIARKENVEDILVDWYRGIVEERYDNDYGFLRIQGYGDGEIGISFNAFVRKGRAVKIKDHKNLPSILTIISDIMEDVLDQSDSKPPKDRRKDHKKDNGRRGKDLDVLQDEDNRVNDESDYRRDTMRSSNDDEIIAMFLDKIKTNGTNDNDGNNDANHHYLSVEDAYQAFELLFGTRLSDRMAERLNDLDKNRFRKLDEGNSKAPQAKGDKIGTNRYDGSRDDESKSTRNSDDEEKRYQNLDGEDEKEKKKIRSGLVIRLPKIDEEFVSRKITDGLVNIGRKMKMKMSQLVPGITFIFSFFIQMALSHARAAASIAGMMSNMALGSAMLSMVRESLFGPMTHPKIKYVYDNEAAGAGITWPQHNYHG